MRYGQIVSRELFVQHPPNKLTNAILGVVGEAGEIADLFKKRWFHPGGVDKQTNEKLRLEIGDLLFYLALLNEEVFGDSLVDVARDNLRKLKGRWPERYDVDLDELTL